jgi:hypothetical protein
MFWHETSTIELIRVGVFVWVESEDLLGSCDEIAGWDISPAGERYGLHHFSLDGHCINSQT